MKQIPLLLIALVACIAVQAQGIQFGPRLGVSFTNVSINGFKADGLTRLHAGVFVAVPVANRIEIESGAIYSQQGTYQTGQLKGRSALEYLNIPVLGRYKLLDALAVYAGPQIGIGLSSSFKAESNGRVYPVTGVIDPIDVTLLFGADYEVYQGISAGARYFFSLGDMHGDDNKVGKNYVFQLSLAYDLARLFFRKE